MQYEDLRSYYLRYHDMVVETVTRLEIAQSKIEDFDKKEKNYKRQIEVKDRAIDIHKKDIKDLKTDLEEVRIKHVVQANDLQNSMKKNSDLESQLESFKGKMGKIPELETELLDVQTRNSDLQARLDELTSVVDKYRDKRDAEVQTENVGVEHQT